MPTSATTTPHATELIPTSMAVGTHRDRLTRTRATWFRSDAYGVVPVAFTPVAIGAQTRQVVEPGLAAPGEGKDMIDMELARQVRGWRPTTDDAAEPVTLQDLMAHAHGGGALVFLARLGSGWRSRCCRGRFDHANRYVAVHAVYERLHRPTP